MPKMSLVSNAIGIVVGLVGLISLYSFNPVLCIVAFGIIVIWCAYILFEYKFKPFKNITKGMRIIEEKLNSEKFHPDIISDFNRTSGVIAGISRHPTYLQLHAFWGTYLNI